VAENDRPLAKYEIKIIPAIDVIKVAAAATCNE
jgi:hypothetical protein